MDYQKIFKTLLISIVICLLFNTLIWAQSQEPVYENEAKGINITGPAGWYMATDEEETEPSVMFSKNPFDLSRLSTTPIAKLYPAITLSTYELKPEYKTLIDYADSTISFKKEMSGTGDFKIIKEPTIVTLAGQEAAEYICEATMAIPGVEKVERMRLRIWEYIFMKDNLVYFFRFDDIADNFDNNAKYFEATVKSLILK